MAVKRRKRVTLGPQKAVSKNKKQKAVPKLVYMGVSGGYKIYRGPKMKKRKKRAKTTA